MDKNSKFNQRKLREQPQQHLMHNPPLLHESKLDEEYYDKWRVINMQYQALFKKNSEISFENRQVPNHSTDFVTEKKPVAKSSRFADNKLDQKYLNEKLMKFEKQKQEKTFKKLFLLCL